MKPTKLPKNIQQYLNGVAEGRLMHVIAMEIPMCIAMQEVKLFDLNPTRILDAERMADYLEKTSFQCTGQWGSFNARTRQRLLPELVIRVGSAAHFHAWNSLASSPKKLSLDGLIGFLGILMMAELKLRGEDSYSEFLRRHLAKLKLGKRDLGLYLTGLLLDSCHPAKRTSAPFNESRDSIWGHPSKLEKILEGVLKVLTAKPVAPYEKASRASGVVLVPPSTPKNGKFQPLMGA